jgi:CRISPR/Cas system-associated exonuclease Cas4 (RecB family)
MDKDELDKKANRLIYVKKSIAELEEKEIKETLGPHVGLVEPLLMLEGVIYLYAEKTKKTINRQQVLEYIENKYGVEVALDVDRNCTKKKRMAKRLHVKTWKKEK